MNILSALLGILLAAPALAAGRDAQLIEHVRKSFSIPREVPLKLSSPRPSDAPGLQKAELTIGQGPRSQKQTVYLLKDGKHYFMGELKDMTLDPDQERWSKVSLEDRPSKGPQDAKVTIVEFSDLECPYCRKAHLALANQFKPYEDRVRLVFKYFPLRRIHPWAQSAAAAASCAYRQDEKAAWKLIDGIFEDQKEIKKEALRAKVVKLAGDAGIDLKAFKACIDKKGPRPDIDKDLAEGEAAGVRSTPSFLVNGRLIRGYSSFKPFKAVIEEKLKEASD